MMNGYLLNERYRIKGTVGGGGMANVYLARDEILNRDVAIKVMRLEYADDEEFIARFHREALAATSLSHPNIVSIYDVGEDGQMLFMAMEYVDGSTLKEYIQKHGPIPVEESIEIMTQISSAIAHAHDNDIIHRDIKPQNILIDAVGQVKVTDFGIAVALSSTTLTHTNSILGSVHYLSPEQARGGTATKQSDIYSLGIVLYELLTGRLPFSGESAVSVALKHLQDNTPSVRDFDQQIPQSVENIVLRATTKDPAQRYQTVYELEDDLTTALDSNRLNEAKFTLSEQYGDETKAIPIITDDYMKGDDQETIGPKPTTQVPSSNVAEKTKTEKAKPTKKKKKKNKKRRKWPYILTVILLVVIAGFITAFFWFQPKDVDVPDLKGMEYEKAIKALEKANLQHNKKMQADDEVKEGYVIKTTPDADKSVKEKSKVNVYVSQGKEKVKIDDYVGEDFEQTKGILEDQGFDVIGYDKYSDDPKGEITKQIQPEPDAKVVPGESRVIFEYSNGPEPASLADLSGLTKDEAKDKLADQGLKMNVKDVHSDSIEENKVVKQDPSPGTKLESGKNVDVYISKGPKDKKPNSKEVSFTVPYNPEKNDEDDDDEQKKVEQTVKIYIDDMNHKLSDVAEQETITKDTKFTITLTIPPDKKAEYKVMRDDDVIKDKSVSYEEGE